MEAFQIQRPTLLQQSNIHYFLDLPIKFSPGFAPGYYEQGSGRKMGDVLEFKSELKIGLDIFGDSKIGYTYSHISNNDWGTVNPGADNQSITFSKNF